MERTLHLLGLSAHQLTTTLPRLSDDVIEHLHQEMAHNRPAAGLLCVATTAGTEIYLDGTDADASYLLSLLAEEPDRCSTSLALVGDGAVAHLFRSAAGLESPILGDTQVLAHLRAGAERAQRHDALSHLLSEVVERALALGRHIRDSTEIAAGRADIGGSIARTIAERGLTFAPVVLVGHDDAAARTLAAFSHAPRPVAVLGRDASRSAVLAKAFDVAHIDVEDLEEWAGAVFVITTPQVPAAIRALVDDARLVIDVVPGGCSVPADVELDDLSDWADPRRLSAVAFATDICDEALADWTTWIERRPFETAVGDLYRDLDQLIEQLEAGDAAIAVRNVVRRWLNPHVSALRDAVSASSSDPETMQEAR